MRPWYLGLGAPPAGYSQAIGQLQALANANPGQQGGGIQGSVGGSGVGTAEIPGQVAYAIALFVQSVGQFSGADAAAVQSTDPYKTLVAQMNAVVANGDYSPGSQQATSNYYTKKGNYNVAAVAAAANALIGFVSGLTGAGGAAGPTAPSNLPGNSTFVPVALPPTKILTSKGSGPAISTAPGGQVVGGPVPLSPVTVGVNPVAMPYVPGGPSTPCPSGMVWDTSMGACVASAAAGAASTSSGDAPPPLSATIPSPAGTSTVTTDPSTGSTTVTTVNPDGSTTVTSSGGPGGESSSYTIPAPYLHFFHPRDNAGKLALSFGLGALAIGALVLLVNSKEGEKVLEVVAKPVDDAAKAVGIPDVPLVPELPIS